MKIWGTHEQGHDGSISVINGNTLSHHLEVSKVGYPKLATLTSQAFLDLMGRIGDFPEAIASSNPAIKYFDSKRSDLVRINAYGKRIPYLVVPHLRAHVISAYAMSPYSKQDAYCLVWEGTIGRFCRVSPDLTVVPVGSPVMSRVGSKYRALYRIVATKVQDKTESGTAAGTLMALISFADSTQPTDSEKAEVVRFLCSSENPQPFQDENVVNSAMVGGLLRGIDDVMDPRFHRMAKFASDFIFQKFYDHANRECRDRLPLVISGGCGYNCDWNTAWLRSGLFDGVFVPPTPGDAGISLGASVDLKHALTGDSSLDWDVFSGPELTLNYETIKDPQCTYEIATPARLAEVLAAGNIVPVAYGKSEIGPRALGHRSLLVDPTLKDSQDRMNTLKVRQSFRPVAPICVEDRVSQYFDWTGPTPYMLHFQKVLDKRLVSVTHVDGTARAQTVTKESDKFMYDTLLAFEQLRGVACLGNSSLNLPGGGFLHSVEGCYKFAISNNLKYFMAGNRLYTNWAHK